jgi:hypothetical protein
MGPPRVEILAGAIPATLNLRPYLKGLTSKVKYFVGFEMRDQIC